MNKAQIQACKNRHIRTNATQANLTIDEIAKILGLPKARVRKIEARAIMKIRKNLKERTVRLHDLI